MALNPKIKNPLILSIVSTVFLIPVLVLTMYIFENEVKWLMLVVTVVIYFVIIFLVFLYYRNISKKQ
jgi:Na+-driven multidrug efflux pump